MTDEKYTMHQVLKDALESFQEYIEGYPDDFNPDNPDDIIYEIADSHVPVYNSDLLDLAADDNSIALEAPEIGPAFDGSPTPINIIAANVYEAITAHLWEYWNKYEIAIRDTLKGAKP